MRPIVSSGKAYSGISSCFRSCVMSVDVDVELAVTKSERRCAFSVAAGGATGNSLVLMEREMGRRWLVAPWLVMSFSLESFV